MRGCAVDKFFLIAVLGQMLGGVVMAVGVIVGLRLALPSLARALVREMEAARSAPAEEAAAQADQAAAQGRPVVTLERRE